MLFYIVIVAILVFLFRPTSLKQTIKQDLVASAQHAFETLKEPDTFYYINSLGEGVHKEYHPTITFRDDHTIDYELLHKTKYKDIVTPVSRFDINTEMLSFKETFYIPMLRLRWNFDYTFEEVNCTNCDAHCHVTLGVYTTGPWISVLLSRKAKKDFTYKFGLTNKYFVVEKKHACPVFTK
eukprot:TRINITY_DN12394_c0_g1_i1.p1 TRINITY_DN12394_c0_g1~~TRINITY_DN12394_c0_g1_i1.p1  ORF type:complete len:181 (+),score=25.03 TRINITY_DN12394_c0_g1_i1:49-591(+)